MSEKCSAEVLLGTASFAKLLAAKECPVNEKNDSSRAELNCIVLGFMGAAKESITRGQG